MRVLSMNRRTLLVSLSLLPASTLAGCTSLGQGLSGTDDAETPDPVFLQNELDEPQVFTVTVTRPTDGETLVEGTYRLPGHHFVRFSEIGVTGETYDVSASVANGDSVEERWMPDSCSDVTGQAAIVRLDTTGLSYDQNGCDVYVPQPDSELTPEEAAVNSSESE